MHTTHLYTLDGNDSFLGRKEPSCRRRIGEHEPKFHDLVAANQRLCTYQKATAHTRVMIPMMIMNLEAHYRGCQMYHDCNTHHCHGARAESLICRTPYPMKLDKIDATYIQHTSVAFQQEGPRCSPMPTLPSNDKGHQRC